MSKTKQKLSKASKDKIEAFDEAAKHWGCVEEYGFGSALRNSKKVHEETLEALTKRMLYLENKINKLKHEQRRTQTSFR